MTSADTQSCTAKMAQPEPEVVGLSDEELLALMPKDMRDEFSYAAKVCSDATGGQVKPGIFRVCLNRTALDFARAALARYDRPAPAAEGEVAELVAWLREGGEDAAANGWDHQAQQFARAADLLERQAAPVPVAVSERLPGANDVEAKLRYCWWWNQEQDVWMYGDASHADHGVYTHWLPSHALPLPSGEVE